MKKFNVITAGIAALAIVATSVAIGNVKVSANQSSLSLDDIQNKMLNAVDNYQDLKGSFHIIQKPINVDDTVEFEIHEGDSSAGSYVKATNNKSKSYIEQHSDGDTNLIVNPAKSEFTKDKIRRLDIPKGPRYTKHEDGTESFVIRQDPAWSNLAHDVSFPQNYGFWLNDKSTTQVVGQEKYLNRDAVVVTGKLDPVLAEKHQASNFKMWVDSKTGVLLKLQEANNNNEITNEIEVLELKVNQGVDKSKFSTAKPTNLTDKSMYKQN